VCFKNTEQLSLRTGIAFQDSLARLAQDLLYAWNHFVELLAGSPQHGPVAPLDPPGDLK